VKKEQEKGTRNRKRSAREGVLGRAEKKGTWKRRRYWEWKRRKSRMEQGVGELQKVRG
jgi:hypothetical protein